MIAIDSSSLIAYLRGDAGTDVDSADLALRMGQAVLPPVVLTEMLSIPGLGREVAGVLRALPLLKVDEGFWERAAATRAKMLAKKRRARLADSLIAQSCLDHKTPLITRDSDFRHFAALAGLVLL